MTATTANVNVTITANGATPAQGVTFAFAPGTGLPAGVLSSDGSLDFSKAYAKGTAIALVFNLQTSSLAFGSSTYPLNIYAQGGASNACWIGSAKPLKGPYSGTEFSFPANALGPGNSSLSVIDNNDDGLTWYYELWVWLGGAAAQKFGHDPHIINHSTNI
ncbi:MAG TPA: hypothetical protein VI258_04275 [Rhodanobacteraceae bacterium]